MDLIYIKMTSVAREPLGAALITVNELLNKLLYPFGVPGFVDRTLGGLLVAALYLAAFWLLRKFPLKRGAALDVKYLYPIKICLNRSAATVLSWVEWILALRFVLELVRCICFSALVCCLWDDLPLVLIDLVVCLILAVLGAAPNDDLFLTVMGLGFVAAVEFFVASAAKDEGLALGHWPFYAAAVLVVGARLLYRKLNISLSSVLFFREDALKREQKNYWGPRMQVEDYVQHPLTAPEYTALEHALAFSQGAVPTLNKDAQISMTNDRYLAYLREVGQSLGDAAVDDKIIVRGEVRELMLHSFRPQGVEKVFAAKGLSLPPTESEYTRLLSAVFAYGDALSKLIPSAQQELRTLYQTECEIAARGSRGEARIFEQTAQLKRQLPTLRSLENFRVHYSGGSAETDLLLISPQGVFCLEIKNYNEGGQGNYDLVIHPDGSWYKQYGDQLHPIGDSPFTQNAIHASAIREAFANELSRIAPAGVRADELVHAAVVLGSDVAVNNQSSYPVLHGGTIYSYMSQFPSLLTPEQVEQLYRAMSARALPALDFSHPDFLARQEQLRALSAELQVLCGLQTELRLSEKYRIFPSN